MTQEEIKEGNRLIAEFMGKHIWRPVWNGGESCYNSFRSTKDDCELLISNSPFLLGNSAYADVIKLYYDSDWNALIPVVEKIERIKGTDVKIRNLGCEIFYMGKTIGFGVENNKRDAVFQAVVQFINWYNTNGKH